MTRNNDSDLDQTLHAYILDYFRKKHFVQSGNAFMQEANLSASEPVNIDSPEGFLYEWWSLFWDIYNARNNKPSSNEAQIYTELQRRKPPHIPPHPQHPQHPSHAQAGPQHPGPTGMHSGPKMLFNGINVPPNALMTGPEGVAKAEPSNITTLTSPPNTPHLPGTPHTPGVPGTPVQSGPPGTPGHPGTPATEEQDSKQRNDEVKAISQLPIQIQMQLQQQQQQQLQQQGQNFKDLQDNQFRVFPINGALSGGNAVMPGNPPGQQPTGMPSSLPSLSGNPSVPANAAALAAAGPNARMWTGNPQMTPQQMMMWEQRLKNNANIAAQQGTGPATPPPPMGHKQSGELMKPNMTLQDLQQQQQQQLPQHVMIKKDVPGGFYPPGFPSATQLKAWPGQHAQQILQQLQQNQAAHAQAQAQAHAQAQGQPPQGQPPQAQGPPQPGQPQGGTPGVQGPAHQLQHPPGQAQGQMNPQVPGAQPQLMSHQMMIQQQLQLQQQQLQHQQQLHHQQLLQQHQLQQHQQQQHQQHQQQQQHQHQQQQQQQQQQQIQQHQLQQLQQQQQLNQQLNQQINQQMNPPQFSQPGQPNSQQNPNPSPNPNPNQQQPSPQQTLKSSGGYGMNGLKKDSDEVQEAKSRVQQAIYNKYNQTEGSPNDSATASREKGDKEKDGKDIPSPPNPKTRNTTKGQTRKRKLPPEDGPLNGSNSRMLAQQGQPTPPQSQPQSQPMQPPQMQPPQTQINQSNQPQSPLQPTQGTQPPQPPPPPQAPSQLRRGGPNQPPHAQLHMQQLHQQMQQQIQQQQQQQQQQHPQMQQQLSLQQLQQLHQLQYQQQLQFHMQNKSVPAHMVPYMQHMDQSPTTNNPGSTPETSLNAPSPSPNPPTPSLPLGSPLPSVPQSPHTPVPQSPAVAPSTTAATSSSNNVNFSNSSNNGNGNGNSIHPNNNNNNNILHNAGANGNLRPFEPDSTEETDISSLFSGDDTGHNFLHFHEELQVDQHNDSSNGAIRYKELTTLTGHNSKAVCCDFSADGKMLASGGHDKKVIIWDVAKRSLLCNPLTGHNYIVTDVRFSPTTGSPSILATGSFDKTVRLWNAWEPDPCVATYSGHTGGVTSVDIHPGNIDALCSVDQDGDMRFWSVSTGKCTNILSKSVSKIARFQPPHGRLLAAGNEHRVKLFDTTTLKEIRSLQGHTRPVLSICWHPQSPVFTTASENCVLVWDSTNPSQPLRAFSQQTGINCCAFHPTQRNVVIIGTYQRVYLWDFESDKSVTIAAHDNIVSGLASSFASGMFATASHDTKVKLFL